MIEGDRRERIVYDSDLASVPGTLVSGRTETSNVARDGFSAASRTSIGPDIDARALVSPRKKSNIVRQKSVRKLDNNYQSQILQTHQHDQDLHIRLIAAEARRTCVRRLLRLTSTSMTTSEVAFLIGTGITYYVLSRSQTTHAVSF